MTDNRPNHLKWVKPFIYGNVFLAVYLYAITEGLSLFHLLRREYVVSAWIVFLAGVIIAFIVKRKTVKSFFHSLFHLKFSKTGLLEAAVILFLAITMFFLAWRIVPYNWDSMTYHCSRVTNWIQNQSVDYYPTNIPRQLYSPPFAEYVLLNTYFIFGSDIAFNLVQWYAYLIAAIMVFAICRRLNVNAESALAGSILAMTMPIAVAESVTTQTDLVASVWLLFFVYIVIDFSEYEVISLEKKELTEAGAAGCIVGIGFLCKSQICISMFILFSWMVIVRIKKKDVFSRLIVSGGIAAAFLLPFLLPFFVRNYNYTGNILASGYFSGIAAGTLQPKYLLVNAIKNWAQTSVSYYFPALNSMLLRFVHFAAESLGVDIDHPLIAFNSISYDPSFYTSYHCDTATAPIIGYGFIAAVLIGCLLFIIKRKKVDDRCLFSLALFVAVVIGFAEVRWQPWVTRLLLPTYVLTVLFIILVLNRAGGYINNKNIIKAFTLVFSIVLLFTSQPAIAYQKQYADEYKNAETRLQMYFEDRGEWPQYKELIQYVKSKEYTEIGIYLGADTYEYPLWAGLKNDNTRIIQVVPGNKKAAKVPECIIAMHSGGFEKGSTFEYLGNEYVCTYCALGNSDYSILESLDGEKPGIDQDRH